MEIAKFSPSPSRIQPSLAPAGTAPFQGASGPVDQVQLQKQGATSEAAYCRLAFPSAEPTRRPLDVTGLEQVLNEFQKFGEREYYNEGKDASARQVYYKDIDWSADGKTLFNELASKVKDSHSNTLSYRPSEHLYPWVDLHPDGQLRSIYSNTAMSASKAIIEDWEVGQLNRQAENGMAFVQAAFSPEAAAVAFAAQETAALNCEHVVPQSWFGKAQPARGDLHHLFACEMRCNSHRGNLPFDEFKNSRDNWRNDCGSIGSGGSFEPAGGKGPAARATLYFLLRYPGVVNRYDAQDIQLMQDWSRRYPPTLWEKHRNAAIEELQGNRNPLIDFPDMAEKIDFRYGLKKAPKAALASA